MYWNPTTKGYTVKLADGKFCTVFYRDQRKNSGWVVAYDNTFDGSFATVFEAIGAAEAKHGFAADMVLVRDIPPRDRTTADWPKYAKVQAEKKAQEQAMKDAEARRQEETRKWNQEFRQRQAEQFAQFQQAFSGWGPWSGSASGTFGSGNSVDDMFRAYADSVMGTKPSGSPGWAKVLGLSGSGPWTLEEAQAAFRLLAKKYHPDVGGSAEQMQKILVAWKTARAVCKK